MIYNEYGKTGIKVSALGMGGMRFENQDDPEASASLVNAAYDAGINYFDTAPGYGKSEDIFGIALKAMRKTRTQRPFYVATKTFGENPADVRKDLENSLKRMGLDYIDFYHVWCIMSLENYRQRARNGVLQEFAKLQAEGLIRHVCISTHMAGADIRALLADYPFAGILLGYSIMNFAYRTDGIEAASASGMGVTVMNPLGGGIIPQNPARFAFVRTSPQETVVEGALKFLMHDRRISTVLVGFANKPQLAEAIRAVDGFGRLQDSDISRIKQNLRQSFNELCTTCCYCDVCAQKMPVPRLMDAYNHYVLANENPGAMINRLKWHWGIGIEDAMFAQCTRCGLCEQKCTQHLPIRKRLETIKAAVENALAHKKENKG